jgi:quercetin dioxygenase-like cupin family protein
MKRTLAIVLSFVLACSAAISSAQTASPAAPPIKRTVLQRADVPNTSLEMIYAVVEIGPGFRAGRHQHPGVVMAQVVEGEFWLQVDGQAEQFFRAGDSVTLPDRVIHNEGATNKGVKLNVIYVLEKGKPIAMPLQ